MSAVEPQIRARAEAVSELLRCMERLPELERLYWYPRALPALTATVEESPEAQAPAQALLLAVRQDLAALRMASQTASPTGPS